MTITLTPETETRLRRQAERSGEDINNLADSLIAHGLPDNADDDLDHLTAAEQAEIQAGIERGFQAVSEGRIKSQAQAVAEARQRHGFPASWGSGAEGVV